MHEKEDLSKLRELHDKEQQDKLTFKTVLNKRRLTDFEMDMLFFDENTSADKDDSEDEF